MKTIQKNALVIVLLGVVGCGQVSNEELTQQQTREEKSNGKDLNGGEEYVETAFLTGYLANAFDVVVDGQRYSDTEDYYTQKITQLTNEANASGYAGWDLSFDAEIGLDDLAYGMVVFASAAGSRGYAGHAPMEYNGSFSMEIPDNARNAVYAVRANKKVGVTLTPPQDSDKKAIEWCYNFSAELSGISLGSPVILNKFSSRLTKYACATSKQDGIEIPVSIRQETKTKKEQQQQQQQQNENSDEVVSTEEL